MLKNQHSVSTSHSQRLIWVAGLFVLALVVTLIAATAPTLVAQWTGNRAVVQPTACPDAIACHAIKRNAAIETAAPTPKP